LDHGTHAITGEDGKVHLWPFMVMELVAGRSLRATLEGGRLSPAETVRLCREMLRALSAAHAVGVIHRDLKPDNVMLTSHGHLKIMDFGIARSRDARSMTESGTAMGTPLYMSPEHLNAKTVSPASDV